MHWKYIVFEVRMPACSADRKFEKITICWQEAACLTDFLPEGWQSGKTEVRSNSLDSLAGTSLTAVRQAASDF